MVPAKERDALRLEEDDLDFDAMPMDELIDLAGPAARFVAAAKRRSKVPIEVSKEVQKEQRAARAKAKKSWADMMEEDNFDWMPAAEAAMKSDKSSFSTAAPSEKWSWSTAATEQDFDDLLEALPEELEEQAPVAPQIAQQERERQEQEEKLRKQKQREQQEQRLQEQKEIIQERLRLQQELEQSRLRQKELEREQLRQEQQQQEQLRQHLQQEQLRQLQMQQEQLRQQQVQQEQLRQQQVQQEQLRQQQVQQEQLRQQQVQQEQLRQQQVQQEQLRQQQVQQEQLRQQQVQQEQLRQQQFQQQLHLQQGMQMQQMQLQQVPVLIAVPCMAVQPMQSMQQIQPMQTLTQQTEEKEESQEVVLPGGPQFGQQHRFHQKNTTMGVLSPDARTFTKCSNKGRLSIVCENRVHFNGVVRYAVQFTEGELCSADGVGFILSSDLPCTKNIQKIVSVFANRTGRICVRVHEDVKRCQQRVKCLELGDWLEVISDLEQQKVTFVVWPQDKSAPTSATISFGDVLAKARGRSSVPRSSCGYLAVVMKHLGVSVNLAS